MADDLLLTDEEIKELPEIKYEPHLKQICISCARIVAQAQLVKAKPIIEEQAKREERERIIGEIKRYTYKVRCLPFQATKIRFIRIPEPTFQALKEGEL